MNRDILISSAPEPNYDWQGVLTRGYGLVLLLAGALLVWATVARLDGAVVAPGTVSVQSNVKTVQHLEGGIVTEIVAHNGDVVKPGDVLVRLDPTRSAAGVELLTKQQAISKALETRLLAQNSQQEQLTFPQEVLALSSDPMIAAAIEDNRRQFQARRQALLSALDVLDKQADQVRSEAEQARTEQSTAEQQLASINKELPALKALLDRGLVPLPRVTALEREEQSLKGIATKAEMQITRSQEKIGELDARREQLRQEYKQEAAGQLPDVRKALSDVSQQLVVAADTLRRIDVVAPVAGTVQQLKVFTIGGVLRPGDPILEIVPSSDKLVVRGKVSPIDIDRVRKGMAAELRFPQFQLYQAVTIKGEVTGVSSDTIADENSRNERFYSLVVSVDRATMPKEISDKLIAGMTVDILVPTEARTVLQFLVSPILNRMAFSMRER